VAEMIEMDNSTFEELYNNQMQNQLLLLRGGSYEGFASHDIDKLPDDDPKLMSYHIQQLVSEIGEVLEADKRWKNFRKDKYDNVEKLMEISDCFIVLMNIAIFSGYTAQQVADAILTKEVVVRERIMSEVN